MNTWDIFRALRDSGVTTQVTLTGGKTISGQAIVRVGPNDPALEEGQALIRMTGYGPQPFAVREAGGQWQPFGRDVTLGSDADIEFL